MNGAPLKTIDAERFVKHGVQCNRRYHPFALRLSLLLFNRVFPVAPLCISDSIGCSVELKPMRIRQGLHQGLSLEKNLQNVLGRIGDLFLVGSRKEEVGIRLKVPVRDFSKRIEISGTDVFPRNFHFKINLDTQNRRTLNAIDAKARRFERRTHVEQFDSRPEVLRFLIAPMRDKDRYK